MKITPAHDFNDFEVGKRHNLPLINVLDRRRQDRRSKAMRLFLDGVPTSHELAETHASARPRPLRGAQDDRRASGGGGLLDKIEPHTHMVPHGDRSNVVIEPYPDRPVVRQRQAAGGAGDRGGARRQDDVRAGELGEDLFRLDGEHPALVHLAPALVGPSDPGVVRAGRQGVRRRDRGRGAAARTPTTKRPARSSIIQAQHGDASHARRRS